MRKRWPVLTRQGFKALLRQHRDALLVSLTHLLKHPVTTVLTLGAIAISLALPGVLYLLTTHVNAAFSGWDNRQMSVFLEPGSDTQAVSMVTEQIQALGSIARIETITPEQGKASLQASADLQTALATLEDNPLPTVLVVHPDVSLRSAAELESLAARIAALPGVDDLLLDQAWLEKVSATLQGFQRLSIVVAICFGALVILVIHIGLRIELLQRREEVTVTKLVGGSDLYMQRPFNYIAAMYGFLGASLALLLIKLIVWWLSPQLAALNELYGSHFQLRIPLRFAVTLIVATSFISLLSTSVSMKILLKQIRP